MTLALVASCQSDTVAFQYESIVDEGWEKTDTVVMTVPRVGKSGVFDFNIMLRTDNEYPFRSMTVVAEVNNITRKTVQRDTVRCELNDSKGNSTGGGINLYNHSCPATTLKLMADDSLTVKLYHIMKRETLPGIKSVGMLIEK